MSTPPGAIDLASILPLGSSPMDKAPESDAAGLRDALLAGDRAGARRRLGLEGDPAIPLPAILQGFALAGARHAEAPSGAPHGIVFADAVRDLVPTYAGDEPSRLFEGALETFLRLAYGPADPDALLRKEGDNVEMVAVSELEDALEAGATDGALRVCARLLSVMRTKEAFMERLLEIAAGHVTPRGRSLVFAMSAVKGMHDMTGAPLREVLSNVLVHLAARRPAPSRGAAGPRTLRWDGIFRAAAQRPGLLHHGVVFAAHAFQAQRYAQAAKERMLTRLAVSFDSMLPGWDRAAEPLSVDDPPPSSGEGLATIPEGEGDRLGAALLAGDAAGARSAVRAWWGRVEDPDPIYRWLAQACLAKGSPEETGDLIFVNGARWGAHLLKGEGLALTDRVVDHIAALPVRER